MKDDERKQAEHASTEGGPESIDSVLRAVAHVPQVPVSVPTTIDAPLTPELLEPVPLPRVGDVLGRRYRIEALLGAGGMGAVFAARHVKTGKELAIKVLLPRHGLGRFSRDRVARFVREAQAAGRIRHPNVVDVYDVEEGEGTPYLVMERLMGESLWERIKRGPLSPQEALPILLSAMRGVSEAHRQGVIHRDLKPDNIFLARSGEHDEVVPKVLDFGVSRIVARADSEDPHPTTITQTGYIVGTPAYMPIEQLRGARELDARADVYALGVILYEALSGERPYEAQNNHELVIRMATEPPTPLSHKLPALDPALARIVMKALSRERDDRYPSVEAFAAALSRWRDGERTPEDAAAVQLAPATEPAPPTPEGSARTRRPWLVGALLLLTCVAVALTVWLSRPSAPPAIEQPLPAPKQAAPEATPPPPPAQEAPPAPRVEEAADPSDPAPRAPTKRAKRASRPRDPATPAAQNPQAPDPATDVTLEDF